jgi:hypothetical protein
MGEGYWDSRGRGFLWDRLNGELDLTRLWDSELLGCEQCRQEWRPRDFHAGGNWGLCSNGDSEAPMGWPSVIVRSV